MNKIKVAIIEDEVPAARLLHEMIQSLRPDWEVMILPGTIEESVEWFRTNPHPELLFLDIQMPELNGLEFSKMIDPHTRIVFTTAFGQYAIDGYRVNALDYLLKPISYVDFLQAANKALQWFELVQKPEEIDSIFVKSDYKLVQVDLKKIMYIEGLKDYIKIYTEDAPKPILSLMSMKAMEELLPSSRFIRVHRSFIVQKDKIRVIDRGRIVFDKTYIPISDSYKQVFQTFLDERS